MPMAEISPMAARPLAGRRKAILLLGGIGAMGILGIWCGSEWFSGRAARATHRRMDIEKMFSDHAPAMERVEKLGHTLSDASGPVSKVAALDSAIKEINSIRERTVTIGVGRASTNVNVWTMICKVSSTAYLLDAGMTDLTFVVDRSQKLLHFCQQYEASRLRFEQAMAGIHNQPSSKNFAELAVAAAQFKDSIATVDSHIEKLDGKLAGIRDVFVTSRDLLAKIEYGPVRESAHAMARCLERPINVIESASSQVGAYRAGLDDAMKTLASIAGKARD
jgi:hypothetical protein